MTWTIRPPPAKPLPVVTRPLRDELLSSWLERTAALYDVTIEELLHHFGVTPPNQIRHIDFVLPASVEDRLGWCLRTNRRRIRNHCHIASRLRADGFITMTEPVSHCSDCETKRRMNPTHRPIFRSVFETWQIACGACGRPFHATRHRHGQGRVNRIALSALWLDATEGSALFARYLAGKPCGILPPALLLRLVSARMRRHLGGGTGFGLIVPETFHPGFGAIHSSPVTTIRTKNPFKRLALLAVLHRFNLRPAVWVDELSNAATDGGKAAIASVLSSLPDPIRDYLRQPPTPNLPERLAYASHEVENHAIRLNLSLNLRRIEEFRLKLTLDAAQHLAESQN